MLLTKSLVASSPKHYGYFRYFMIEDDEILDFVNGC